MKKNMFKWLSYLLITCIVLILPLSFNRYLDVSSFINYIIFIDPGHGGKDNGASYLNIYEDEINLKIASKLYEKCLERHFLAYISRSEDYDLASLYAKNRKQEDLKKRVESINHSGCNIFVSIHMNYYSASEVYGPMVYYEKSNDQSYLLSKCIQEELNVLTKCDKKVHYSDFYLFKNCEKTGVLIECGFISNPEEREKLLTDNYQNSIVDAIYEGIYQYYLLGY